MKRSHLAELEQGPQPPVKEEGCSGTEESGKEFRPPASPGWQRDMVGHHPQHPALGLKCPGVLRREPKHSKLGAREEILTQNIFPTTFVFERGLAK